MKIKSKIAAFIISAGMLAGSAFGFAACSQENGTTNTGDEQIRAVYAMYVDYAEAKGESPKSYEEWLDSIKGEQGEKGNGWLVGQTAPAAEDGNNGDLYLDYSSWNVWHKVNGEWILLGNISSGNNSENNPPDGGNRKMTEEEWRQAITNSLSAESYMLSVKENTIYSSGRTIESNGNLFYDGVHGTQYFSGVYTEIDNGIQQQQLGQLYFELVDTDVTAYMQVNDEEWEEVYTITFNTADEALDHLASNEACGATMAYLLREEYNVSRPAYASEAKLLIDLFDVFTYDETTDTYSATLVADYYDNVTFTFKFEDGYLTFIQCDKDINMPYEAESHMTMEISGYNSTVVTVPEEVKVNSVKM